MYLTAERFPIKHAFATREGGVSEGPYASLNLGRSVGDDRERVEENGRRLARALGLTAGQLVAANQVHGDRILEVDSATPGDRMPPAFGDADGLITRAKGVAVGIRTADCTPVLIWAPDVEAVAAVHAGWKGTLLTIGQRAVERLRERYGADPAKMVAAIGPSIRRCCYEVSHEVADQFRGRFGGSVLEDVGPRPHLDLAEANRLALLEAGLDEGAIEIMPRCTCCDPKLFFSHRRDKGLSGRHLSFAVISPR